MIKISIVQSDITEVDADVLVLKYARQFHGADEVVALRLFQSGVCNANDICPEDGDHQWIDAKRSLGAEHVLFLGTPRLGRFRYREIRHFAQQCIELIAATGRTTKTIATTVHGAGYGLDIEEALRAMILGFQQGLTANPLYALRRIVFVEHDPKRFELLQRVLGDVELVLPQQNTTDATAGLSKADSPIVQPSTKLVAPQNSSLNAFNESHLKKKSVFVAMPFSEEFEDVYQFGIYATVRRCGYACEKVDESIFAGSIVDRIIDGIREAEFLIADLSEERPNVYLEVGFAWGLGKPVITLAREGQRLHFDVSHHRCLFYRTIGKLAESLEKTITEMFGPKS